MSHDVVSSATARTQDRHAVDRRCSKRGEPYRGAARGRRVRRAFFLLAILLAGCLRVGPGEDLHLVCERDSSSPWHPYSPDDLARLTRVEGDIDDAAVRAILQVVADRLVTPGAAPYASFGARLTPGSGGSWRFVANGTWPGGEDVYDITGPIARDAPIEATSWLRQQARGVVANESALAGRAEGEPLFATWEPALAGCVALEYPEVRVSVNVDTRLVVSIRERMSA